MRKTNFFEKKLENKKLRNFIKVRQGFHEIFIYIKWWNETRISVKGNMQLKYFRFKANVSQGNFESNNEW